IGFIVGSTGRLSKILSRTRAGIDAAGIAQSPPRFQVEAAPVALRVRVIRSAAIRTLAPVNAEPLEIFKHGGDKLRSAALRIEVFVAENQHAIMGFCALSSDPKGAGMTNVEKSGWRWRKTAAISRDLSHSVRQFRWSSGRVCLITQANFAPRIGDDKAAKREVRRVLLLLRRGPGRHAGSSALRSHVRCAALPRSCQLP